MHQFLRTGKERLKAMTYHCASCDQPLDQAPAKATEGWYIPCQACGIKNLIIPVFKLVRL